MEKSYLIMNIERQKSNLHNEILSATLEIAFFSIIAFIYFTIKYGFDYIILIIFIIPIILLLIISLIIKSIKVKEYFHIDTSKNLITINKRNKINKYNIDTLKIESKIKIDNEQLFLYKLTFICNDKKIYTTYNSYWKELYSSKEFYLLLKKHLNINEIDKNKN